MAATTSEPCPVCGRALPRRGNRKKCRKCSNLTVIEFGVELRVVRYPDRRMIHLYGTEVVRLGQWVPEGKQKQLYGFSDGLWFITTSWPERLREERVRLEDAVYSGWADGVRLGPRIGWLKGFTFGKTSHGGIRARMPKACSCIPEGKYAATLVQQDEYVYLVFRVGPASSVQTT